LGEREVMHVFDEYGWTMRGLEGQGDHLASKLYRHPTDPLRGYTRVLHIEVKRQERLALPQWLRQADEEAPPGVYPVVCFRQSRGRWYAALPLDALLETIG